MRERDPKKKYINFREKAAAAASRRKVKDLQFVKLLPFRVISNYLACCCEREISLSIYLGERQLRRL